MLTLGSREVVLVLDNCSSTTNRRVVDVAAIPSTSGTRGAVVEEKSEKCEKRVKAQ